ncbi:unnamed protein product [Phaeothamnion confervicola]
MLKIHRSPSLLEHVRSPPFRRNLCCNVLIRFFQSLLPSSLLSILLVTAVTRRPSLIALPLTLRADCGFDPLNLASPENLASYRDAEIKHARLAMLAAAGWPISELFDVEIAKDVGLPADVVSPDAAGIGLAPSLLNGGLSAVPLGYWLIVLSLTGFLEIQLEGLKRDGRVSDPGDFGFDPLGLYPKDPAEQMIMKEKEVKHGRISMLAIVAFAFQEASSRIPVVEEAPAFFGLTPGERVAEAEVAEVAKESEDVIYNVLHNILHLI